MAITSIDQLDLNGKYSYADYLKWQLKEYVELFRGKIMRMSPAPLRFHQDVAGNIHRDLSIFLRRKPCKVYMAPFDVRLPKAGTTADQNIFTVVQPDVCIICDRSKLDRRGCVGAPDTVFEIVSQGNVTRDLRDKFSLYEEHGVPEYWVVLPNEKTVAVFLLDAEGRYQLLQEYNEPGPIPVASLPGFSLLWEDIFEE